jgi:hypothetical protein
VVWEGGLAEFLMETRERGAALRQARLELDKALSTRRCMLFDWYQIRLHVKPPLVDLSGVASAAAIKVTESFLTNAEMHRQMALIDRLVEALADSDSPFNQGSHQRRAITICCAPTLADTTTATIDIDGRLLLSEQASDAAWRAVLTDATFRELTSKQQQVEERLRYERAITTAYGIPAITTAPGIKESPAYYVLLEVLANAFHAGVRLNKSLVGTPPRLSFHVVADEDYQVAALNQVEMQAVVLPLSCSIPQFRALLTALLPLQRELREYQQLLEREDQTLRYVQRSTLLRHLWRHRSRIGAAAMIESCCRLRGLSNHIGVSLFRGNEILISDHWGLREDGANVIPWNWSDPFAT